ncbi:ferredoxin [Anaerotignum neopropionicum]|uniref:Ferredoxin n=1 Tax=Anaerotignum neopropionicum TaxID=36847 RepID=A0A136WH93_9FIRM|nr:EFR1 family ferrodoxin [Anaerotignum neopropionicum]KXL53780.1 ferredoxin [Anaerotignum neopropionicum]
MKTEIIYFSATGTTKALVTAISQGLKGDVHFRNITLPESRENEIILDSDLTIIATPVYGERIPHFLHDFFQGIKGNGNPLVAISVYGNMGFGISLEQFKEFSKNNNFRLIATGAFIGQHTYATKTAPVGYRRPDEYDLLQMRIFGEKIQKKIDTKNFTQISVPKSVLPKFITEFPDSGTRFLIRQPQVKKSVCNACGACARKCPVGAIDLNTLEISEQKCLRCYACVKVCPKSARIAEFRLPVLRAVFRHMGIKRKENETFL